VKSNVVERISTRRELLGLVGFGDDSGKAVDEEEEEARSRELSGLVATHNACAQTTVKATARRFAHRQYGLE
jgi:hypothetical protein